MLLHYSGISFISGAINHGFFSGQRSLATAAFGIVLFVLGSWLERRRSSKEPAQTPPLRRTLALGTLLSIGLGLFTGGLQHFPDSPARSSWVVPLGFVLSITALGWLHEGPLRRATHAYGVLGTVFISLLSLTAWYGFSHNPQQSAVHSHAPIAPPSSPVLTALRVDRTLTIRMDDTMRFQPDHIEMRVGETLRLVFHNAGKMKHEWVLGTLDDLQAHKEGMAATATHEDHHAGNTAITLDPGATGELILQIRQPGRYHIACLIPGHEEAGMRGQLTVLDASPASAPPTHPEHDGHTH